ncbi:MAG TPA: hypothetical protein VFX84_01550 [Candidatus Saccharimonadales bacterium]|nr:hypothetical protein [Candidatus Saccharimonadales bacterium]
MSERGPSPSEVQDDPVTAVLASDPYVMHVVDRVDSGVELEHEVEDWSAEMVAHLQEKYDVDRNTALDAIIECHVNFLRSNGTEARAD